MKGFVPSDVPPEAVDQFQKILTTAMSELIGHYELTHAYDPNQVKPDYDFQTNPNARFLPSLQKAFDKQNLELTLLNMITERRSTFVSTPD